MASIERGKPNNKLVGGLERGLFSHVLGMSSSQLTNSMIFQRGRLKPPTSKSSRC